ncbi:EAL domain-containing protein [Sulfuriflexus mobilis]|uniref:EAL domain-containing protein n=1 Tax=Sulfuriflexus mobilis TaxID=1811807 RepID=UPI000F83135F|nr:EAL domain-containing protein [Sulfuriflexus mobilis]
MKKIFLALFLVFPISLVSGHTLQDKPGTSIRVGVWNNPPIVLQDEGGQWRGIAIDTLRSIAELQGWQLEFVPGSFADHLKGLDNHQIDILTAIAYSDKRAQKYSFSRNALISNWGLIYTRTNSNIGSLLELEGKRVAVMRNNIHAAAFRELVEKFGVKLELVERENFSDVMESVRAGEADVGVANRLFGAVNANAYHLVETGIVFNPINIHYAAPHTRHKAILDTIDVQLNQFKADTHSVYYAALQRWMNQSIKPHFPDWLLWLVLGLFSIVMLMAGLAILLRRQVSARTRELQAEVDERRKTQVHLDRLAYYDPLTGLPNRVSFSETLKVAIASACRRDYKLAVLFIDLDRFKTINDSLGHDAGDKLITHVAQRLKGCLRDEDTINRFGGDEFVAILPGIIDISNIDLVCKRMLRSMRAPFDIGVTDVYSSASIGVALYPDDDDTSDSLLQDADVAMYHAKEQGGNNYQFYNAEFTNRVRNRLSLETRLRHALERDELRLHYQPIFNIADQRPVGVEALMRWEDPERGLVPPDSFIPLAEETGLIVPLGEWVLEHACAQVREWDDQGLSPLRLAVNVSSRQFEHNKLLATVARALRNARLDPQRLELEITERMFLNISDKVAEVFDKLKSEGVELSIDDFGTGYSSLSYLKQLPIDTLKIDRSFIRNIPDDKSDAQIASTIITMAQGLGLDVVAEGIETEQQFNFLAALGCGRGQGYYMARPQPAEDLARWLRNDAPLAATAHNR